MVGHNRFLNVFFHSQRVLGMPTGYNSQEYLDAAGNLGFDV